MNTPKQVTLSTLGRSSAQEVFDWAVFNLVKQGTKSEYLNEVGDRLCAYRGEDNTKCAAGWVISDEEYSEWYEGATWDELVKEKKVPKAHAELIFKLQAIHDNEPPESWPSAYNTLADEYGLVNNIMG